MTNIQNNDCNIQEILGLTRALSKQLQFVPFMDVNNKNKDTLDKAMKNLNKNLQKYFKENN